MCWLTICISSWEKCLFKPFYKSDFWYGWVIKVGIILFMYTCICSLMTSILGSTLRKSQSFLWLTKSQEVFAFRSGTRQVETRDSRVHRFLTSLQPKFCSHCLPVLSCVGSILTEFWILGSLLMATFPLPVHQFYPEYRTNQKLSWIYLFVPIHKDTGMVPWAVLGSLDLSNETNRYNKELIRYKKEPIQGLCFYCCRLVIQLYYLTFCDPTDCSMPSFPVLHCLLEFVQTRVYWVDEAIQSSCPLSSSSPAFNLSQHQDLFQWVSSLRQVAKSIGLHQVAKVLEHQL